jgi:dihydrofolate reductase
MRRLILQTGVSIDGYVAALDGSHPWSDGSEDEAVKRWILDSVWGAGAHLMGRVTYEEMAAFWPTSTSEYARPMNEIPRSSSRRPYDTPTGPRRESPAATSAKRSGVSSGNPATT